MDLALVSVWYNKDKFIYNTTCNPFWHNILYYSQYFKYYILYYVENESSAKIPTAEGPVKFINFKNYPESKNVTKLKHVMNKIDYMKLQFIFNSDIVPETFVLLMDMDCQLTTAAELKMDNLKKVKQQYYLTPYTDSSTKFLYRPMSNYVKYGNSFDSYIENYATFINKTQPFFKPWHGVDIRVENETNQFFMYAQYLQIVQLYMSIFHQYALPAMFDDYRILNPIQLTFHRGSSYKEDYYYEDEYKYEYDYRKPAVFGKQSLTDKLYVALISGRQDHKIIKYMLHNLYRLSYNFQSKFRWSNSLQCYVNVCGVIEDRCNDFNFTGVEFVKPIKMYGK